MPDVPIETLAVTSPATATQTGLVIAQLAGFDERGAPLVCWDGRPALPALTLCALGEEHVGRAVALQFERGLPTHPVVLALVRLPAADAPGTDFGPDGQVLSARIDEDEVVLVAQRRITLRCGAASITLDADGNIEIRGRHLLSRAAGQNRIKGSSVSLN